MSKFTEGPWTTGGISMPYSDNPTTDIWGPRKPGKQSGSIIAKDVSPKNAPIIAAAPELYEALKAVLHEWNTINSTRMHALNALKKAEGEERG